MTPVPPAIELRDVVKDFQALRPLRVRDLVVGEHEIVAIGGLDVRGAEVLTGLVTGAVLPDRGRVALLGEDTAAIASADQWLAALDRVGVVSDRVALLDGFTVAQNIAVPLTLELDPLPEATLARVSDLAAETGLDPASLGAPAGAVDPEVRLRLRCARALAPGPRVVLVEHPTASLSAADASAAMRDLVRAIRARRIASLIVTADSRVSRVADRQLVLDPATGALNRRGLLSWFP